MSSSSESDSDSDVDFNASDQIVLSESESDSDSDCEAVEDNTKPSSSPPPPSSPPRTRTRASRRAEKVDDGKSEIASDTEEEKARIDALYKELLADVKAQEVHKDTFDEPPRKKVNITSVEKLIPKDGVPKEEGTDQPAEAAKPGPPKRRKLMIPTILKQLEAKIKNKKRYPFGNLSRFLHGDQKRGRRKNTNVLDEAHDEWEVFKAQEGIQEELEEYNKGKDGYLARQEFLQRIDYQQFQIECTLRTTRSGFVRDKF